MIRLRESAHPLCVVPLTGCFLACGPRPPPDRPNLWSPGRPCRWWSTRRTSAERGTWWIHLSVGGNHKNSNSSLNIFSQAIFFLPLSFFHHSRRHLLTFNLEAFLPPRTALSSKENSFSRMTALLSLSPTYVTTYMSGAHISNSLSQLMMVERGALTRNGPLEWPWMRRQDINVKHHTEMQVTFAPDPLVLTPCQKTW